MANIKQIKVGSTAYDINDSYANVAYGTCSTEAATAAKVVTINNSNWELKEGSLVIVLFSATNTANNPTLNVGGTGAKNIYYGTTKITTSSLSYAGTASRVMIYVYDGTQYRFSGWGYDSNTTYTPPKLGFGYGTCSTAEATTAKTATLSNYTLTTGGIVSIKFTNAVPANSTLNINSKGAKNIYYRGAAITAGVIKAGDIATFVYSSQYHLIAIDSAQANQNAFSNVTVGSTTIAADTTTDTLTLVAGSNVTLTPDATNDKITIAATDTVYTHPTTSGNKHIPSGGSSGQILRWAADGTAAWGADNNTTYTSLKNPYALTIQGNGTTLTNGTYDGSAAKTVNITPASIGAATSGHTHTGYMASSNPTGTGSLSINRKASTTVGTNSVAAGRDCTASGGYSIAMGDKATASGSNSLAIGNYAEATKMDSIALGRYAKANDGAYSPIAIGYGATATMNYATAIGGYGATASGDTSFCTGLNTTAAGDYQFVYGKHNVKDTDNTYAHIVGNGNSASAQSNAHTLDWNGNAWYAGDVYVGGTSQADAYKIPKPTINVTTTGTDLNNYTEEGTWFFSGDYAPTNIPVGVNGWLQVIKSKDSNFIKQIWYRAGTPNSNDAMTYIRTYNGSAWSNWMRTAGQQVALWTGTSMPLDTNTLTLSQAISAQPNGIVLVFSAYSGSAAKDSHYQTFFIPKQFVSSFSGKGMTLSLREHIGGICTKYVYITDTTIKGHAQNNQISSTANGNGIIDKPGNFCLRAVYGV